MILIYFYFAIFVSYFLMTLLIIFFIVSYFLSILIFFTFFYFLIIFFKTCMMLSLIRINIYIFEFSVDLNSDITRLYKINQFWLYVIYRARNDYELLILLCSFYMLVYQHVRLKTWSSKFAQTFVEILLNPYLHRREMDEKRTGQEMMLIDQKWRQQETFLSM
jgi:hypothetical protein